MEPAVIREIKVLAVAGTSTGPGHAHTHHRTPAKLLNTPHNLHTKTTIAEAKPSPSRLPTNDTSPSEEELTPNSSCFDVFLRLRAPSRKYHQSPRFLTTVPAQPTHVYVTPPPTKAPLNRPAEESCLQATKNEGPIPRPGLGEAAKPRTIEKFSFAEIFPESGTQLHVFERTGLPLLIQVLGGRGGAGDGVSGYSRDCILATIGISGSGKTYTIFGSRAQWGMTQMTLKVLFDAVGPAMYPYGTIRQHLRACDNSYATITDVDGFLEVMSPAMNAYLQGATEEAKLADEPDTKDITRAIKGCIDTHCAYAVMLSMYEVYNERVYDLLDASSWEQHQQELEKQAAAPPKAPPSAASKQTRSRPQTPAPRPKTPQAQHPQAQPTPQPLSRRKPLSYRKCNTGHNRHKRVIMGLKKIYVRNMDEAVLLIEHAQACRHASSSATAFKSSRGHAFMAIDIMRLYPVKEGGNTGVKIRGGTFTIVDLAGTERQRRAQNKGEKPPETGGISKSLITLGQCLQMQGKMEDGKPVIPPYEQSKLTEILFANAFRAVGPQKGIMIVTADPQGDYNSTLEILRYSALATEITEPSVVSNGTQPITNATDSNPIPKNEDNESFVIDNEFIKRLVDGLEDMEFKFREAENGRKVAEKQCTEALQRCVVAKQRTREAEEQALQIEIQVREELTSEFELREKAIHGAYMKRIKDGEQAGKEFMDSKLELAMRGLDLDRGDDLERVEELEKENEELKLEVSRLKKLIAEMGIPSVAGGKRVKSEQAEKKVAFG